MTGVTLLLLIVAGFLAAWAGIVSLIGFFGWRPLARQYPADRWPDDEGVRLGWQSGRIGASSYNGVLNAVVAVDGLFLRPIRPFAYNHPPVFIPWAAVTDVRDGMFSSVTLVLEEGRGLRLSGRLARLAKEAWGVWASAGPRRPANETGAWRREEERSSESPFASGRRARTR